MPNTTEAHQNGGTGSENPITLAASGTPEQWATFVRTSSSLKSIEDFLESLGKSGRREAGAFLKASMQIEHEALRRAAIRGLALTGSPEDASFLGQLMLRADLPIEETTEAALAACRAWKAKRAE
jgi:hypothetical protein